MPVEQIRYRDVPVPVERIVEKVVQVPVPRQVPVKQIQQVPVPVEKIVHVQRPYPVQKVVVREVVKHVQVPHEIIQRVEHVQHVVQPVEVIEEPVIQQIVTINKASPFFAPKETSQSPPQIDGPPRQMGSPSVEGGGWGGPDPPLPCEVVAKHLCR